MSENNLVSENTEEQDVSIPRFVKVDITKRSVVRQHLTQTAKAGNVLCNWVFDFSKVSEADLMELASRSVLISRRGTFKKLDKEKIEADYDGTDAGWDLHRMTIDVADYIRESGKKVDKVEKATKLAKGMSNEEKLALLKALQDEVGASEEESE